MDPTDFVIKGFYSSYSLSKAASKAAENNGLSAPISPLGPLLLTWFNFNPNMDK